MTAYIEIEQKIHDTVGLSSVCRNEWCRMLESEMDKLDLELYDYLKSGEVHERFCLTGINSEIRQGYKNLSHDVLG